MRRTVLLLAGLLAAAGGCKKERAAADLPPVPDHAGFPSPTAVAAEYLAGLMARDWARVCATRIESEKRDMARLAGSCEAAFERMFAGQPLDILRGAEPSAERVRGNLASVDFTQPGQSEVAITIYARRSAGGWLAVDIPDEQAP